MHAHGNTMDLATRFTPLVPWFCQLHGMVMTRRVTPLVTRL